MLLIRIKKLIHAADGSSSVTNLLLIIWDFTKYESTADTIKITPNINLPFIHYQLISLNQGTHIFLRTAPLYVW